MEDFESKKYNIRSLLKNEKEESDKDKNYFIPPSQRKYDWDEEDVKKLINDIFDEYSSKDENKFNPYFIGGIVLSIESMSSEDISKKSLEVIDGQQRLTTIILLIAYLVQVLKFQDKRFSKDYSVEHLAEDLNELLYKKVFNYETYKSEKKPIVQRSDKMAEDFEKAISLLVSENLEEIKSLEKKIVRTSHTKNLLDNIYIIKEIIDTYEDEDLIGFIMQLLNHTWIVVTKTISVSTGFLIFEKLNTSGKSLDTQDLLKNYLFQNTSDSVYDKLKDDWDKLLTRISKINNGRIKVTPSEFLLTYITVLGLAHNVTKKRKRDFIFKSLKNLHTNSFESATDLLKDLDNFAIKYKEIKESIFSEYIDKMNFGLGYHIILSFYKKYNKEYEQYKEQLLSIIIRLSMSYLLTGDSRTISSYIPTICYVIINNGSNIEETISSVESYINPLIKRKSDKLENVIANTSLFTKKNQSTLLLSLVEYYLNKKKVDNNYQLFKIMPSEYNESNNYKDIIDDNVKKYSNYIGNLIFINKELIKDNNKLRFLFEDRYNLCRNNKIKINNLYLSYEIENEEIKILEQEREVSWGKNEILSRSQFIAKIVEEIIIKNKLDTDYFN